MVHSGYEASAVDDTFGSSKRPAGAAKATLFGGRYDDSEVLAELEKEPAHSPGELVQVTVHPPSTVNQMRTPNIEHRTSNVEQ